MLANGTCNALSNLASNVDKPNDKYPNELIKIMV